MNYLLTLATVGINDFFNYTQKTNNTNNASGYILIILLIIGISIYAALYIPIKLYQINKNTKAIKEELVKVNKNLSKTEKEFEIIEDNETI